MMGIISGYFVSFVILAVAIVATVSSYSKEAGEEAERRVRGEYGWGSSQDTLDLVRRLAPLAKDPTGEYFGVQIGYSSDVNGWVKIQIMLKNGNRITASGKTLKEAAAKLKDASFNEIAKVLEGWTP